CSGLFRGHPTFTVRSFLYDVNVFTAESPALTASRNAANAANAVVLARADAAGTIPPLPRPLQALAPAAAAKSRSRSRSLSSPRPSSDTATAVATASTAAVGGPVPPTHRRLAAADPAVPSAAAAAATRTC
ncbi:hypothetical protein HK405_000391, partial [Cladochytrium tenue]